MNHPSNEQWMSYCYNELPKGERAELAGHLRTCSDCRVRVQQWEEARSGLSAFKVVVKPRRTVAYHLAPVALKWAAAFAVLCSAIALGRFSSLHQSAGNLSPAVEAALKAKLRVEFAQVLQNEITTVEAKAAAASEQRTKQLIKVFAAEIAAQQKKDLQAVYVAIDKIDSQRASDFIVLKKELDTLAVNADAELRTTERHLLQLAASAQTATSP
jgi:anti-sigma factor RsiW